jgi:hypothetical protein
MAVSSVGQECQPVARRDSHEVSGRMHIRLGDVSLFLTRDELRLLTISLLDIMRGVDPEVPSVSAAEQAAPHEVLS